MADEHGPPDDEAQQRKLRTLLGESEENSIDAKLAEIEERARKIRGANPMPEPPEWNFERPAPVKKLGPPNYRGMGVGLVAAYALIGPIILGCAIGWFIDKDKPGPHSSQTYGALFGVVLGFIGFLVTLSRADKTDPKK